MVFNPFEDRKSRDVRNSIGHSFVQSMLSGSMEPFNNTVSFIINQNDYAKEHIKNYVLNRKKMLNKIFDEVKSHNSSSDNFPNGCIILWNHRLFFEFHEWIEEKWVHQKGEERKVYQSLILAAVVYEHLEYKRPLQAKKVAIKAVKIMENYRESFPAWIDTDLFIGKFEALDPVPPVISI